MESALVKSKNLARRCVTDTVFEMEEQIFVAVCGNRELHDSMSLMYRDRTKNELAWRKVSKEEVGLPGKL